MLHAEDTFDKMPKTYVVTALAYRTTSYFNNFLGILFIIITYSVLVTIRIVPSMGVNLKKLSATNIFHEEQHFPLQSRDEVLNFLDNSIKPGKEMMYPRLWAYPDNDNLRELGKHLVKNHPKLTFNITNDRSDIENMASDEGVLRIVFDEISPNKLDYTVFVRMDGGLLPLGEIPGPAAVDDFLDAAGHTAIQAAVDKAYMDMLHVPQQDWSIVKSPYPEYAYIPPTVGYGLNPTQLWYYLIFGSMWLIYLHGMQLVGEKTSGLGELLAIYGIKQFHSQISWFFTFAMVYWTMSFLQTLVMKIPIFGHLLFLNTSSWVIQLVLLTYYLTSLVFSTLLSTFYTNPTHGSVIFTLFLLASGLLVLLLNMGLPSNWVLRLTCLLPVGGLHQCVLAMIEFEKIYKGVNALNFFSQPPVSYSLLSCGEGIMFMILGSILATILSIYLNLVWPRKYGTNKPWHFPCSSFRRLFKSPSPRRTSSVSPNPPASPETQRVNSETQVAVEVQEIYKSYGHIQALKGVSMNIYENRITALLGENGAGKTTLVGVITGMLVPTSGKILVHGQDIFEADNLENFRLNISFCPQNDLLMEYLSVQQNMVFFLVLQGVKSSDAATESTKWLTQFNLLEKKSVSVAKLSGGMKRKLMLCICLARQSKILLLDEPTSGLDPVARRDVWNILSKNRGEKTVILTTHRMEEADALSDYIAILSDGNLRVFGSNEFLKSRYGIGYQVSFVPLDEGLKLSKEFLDKIQKQFKATSVINKSDKNLVLGVKANDAQAVLSFVERTYGGKVGVSVSSSSVDDVFVQVQQDDGVRISVDESDLPPRNEPELRRRKSLLRCQFEHLIAKRYFWTLHKWKTLLIYFLICPAFASLSALIIPLIMKPSPKEGSVTAELRSYGKTTSLISEAEEKESTTKFSNSIKSSISLQGGIHQVIDDDKDIEEALTDVATNNLKLYRSKIIFSANLRESLTAYYSCVATLAEPIAINMITNAMIHANGNKGSVTVRIFLQPSFDLVIDIIADALKFLVLIGFCAFLLEAFTFFLIFPHEDRTSIMKHLQLMTGLHSSVYWLSNLLVDIVLMLCAVFVSMIVFFLWETTTAAERLFTQWPGFEVMIIVLIIFGLSEISLAYMFSYCFRKDRIMWCLEAFSISQHILFFSYFVLKIAFSLFENTGFLVDKIKYVFYLIPYIPLFESLKLSLSSQKIFYEGHSTRGLFDYDRTFSDLIADIYVELIYLGVDFMLYLILVIIIDDGSWRRIGILMGIKNFFSSLSAPRVFYDSTEVDADVLHERDRIKNLEADNEVNKPFLVVDNLTKSYGRIIGRGCTAVNGVSFTVERGEFFGLLGLNGAGKTTTFKILTGLEDSKGDARIEGKSLVKARRSYLKNLGYCPQSEGLLESMTGKQLLELFGALRGLDGKNLETAVDKWTEILDMGKIRDRRCGEYSGGNKRKLSVAMSLIGDPPTVFLDEPTTGVDPVARRKLWSLFRKSQDTGSTFMLTSHSMDESEALCDRVTIMSGGYMKCIGPIGRLKLSYASGFRITVKMNQNSTEDDSRNVSEFMASNFQANDMTEVMPGLMVFEITSKDMKWSDSFKLISQLKSQVPQINDIVINGCSLEHVFSTVTQPQHPLHV